MPFRTRTRNLILRLGSGLDFGLGPEVTVGQLLKVRNVGVTTLLDLLCVLEGAELAGTGSSGSSSAGWGTEALPLLPAAVRERFGELKAPPGIAAAAGRPVRIRELGQHLWAGLSALPPDALAQLVGWFHAMLPSADDLVVIPSGVRVEEAALCLQEKTQAIVKSTGVLALRGQTVGALLDQGFDAQTILDLACGVEAARWIDVDGLGVWLQRSWTYQVSGQDPRFDVLDDERTIAERIKAAIEEGASQAELRRLMRDLEVANAKVQELISTPFDKALADVLLGTARLIDARAKGLLARFGLLGDPPVTLEEAGRVAGVTRERIRQIESKIKGRWPRHPLFVPTLDMACEIVEQEAPLGAEEFSELLSGKGLARYPFKPEAFLAVLNLAQRPPTLAIDAAGKLRPISEVRDREERVRTVASLREALRAAFRPFMIGEFRRAEAICAERVIEYGSSLRDALDELGVVWLDDSWFWMRGLENRSHSPLRELVLTILSVVHPAPMHIDDVHEGVTRRIRFRQLALEIPSSALRAYLAQDSAFVVSGEFVRSVDDLDPRDRLAATDRRLFEVLEEAGGALDRREFARRAIERGVNESTFSVSLTYSPILADFGPGLWAIRGREVPASAAEQVMSQVNSYPAVKRVLGTRWTPMGQIELAYRVPGTSSVVIGVPAAIKAYVAGRRWRAVDEMGKEVGTVVVDEASSWGYTPFLRRVSATEGQVLLARFDIELGEVTLAIATDAELDWVG